MPTFARPGLNGPNKDRWRLHFVQIRHDLTGSGKAEKTSLLSSVLDPGLDRHRAWLAQGADCRQRHLIKRGILNVFGLCAATVGMDRFLRKPPRLRAPVSHDTSREHSMARLRRRLCLGWNRRSRSRGVARQVQRPRRAWLLPWLRSHVE